MFIDLLSIAPFYITLFLPADYDLRLIRMLRLFRILKLFKHNKSVFRFINAVNDIKSDLALFSIITTLVLFISSILMYIFEHNAQPEAFASVFHSLWWAIVTLTTVGYGDVYPVTLAGRCMTFVLLLLGIAIVSIPAGLLAASLSKVKRKSE